MPACCHHVDSPPCTFGSCDAVQTVAPTCGTSCPSKTSINYGSDKRKVRNNYGFGQNIDSIKNDIMSFGPVSAAFTVYEDFLTYSSGVYSYQTGQSLGGHAIKIYGWGHDVTSGKDYWICMNSWNNFWGQNGAFWIEMGQCGINNEVNAGQI